MPDVHPTPDDGVRRSAEQPWDESTRPSAGPSELAASAQGRAVAGHLVGVHDHLRGELAQVHELVEQVKAGALDVDAARSGINDMTMRQNSWTMGA